MKVALVHDWLTGMRGGEKCLRALLALYPAADVYTLVHVPGTTDPLIDSHVRGTSFLQRVPWIGRSYRAFLPLYPMAVRGIKLSGYDLVISVSHAAAKNVSVPRGTRHLCYCLTPMRYIWDQAPQYLGWKTPFVWPLIRALRAWDMRGSERVDDFVTISRFVAARTRLFYRRRASVIYPPVDTSWIRPAAADQSGEAFLYAGALVPYKRPDLVVRIFNELREPLWIVGSGSEERRLRALALPHIQFFGAVSDSVLADLYRRCRALVFAGTEDFGLVPVECMAAGRPVIAAFRGGLCETVQGVNSWSATRSLVPKGATGVFFRTGRGVNEVAELIRAVRYFMANEQQFKSSDCIDQARRFNLERFFQEWQNYMTTREQEAAGGTEEASRVTAYA